MGSHQQTQTNANRLISDNEKNALDILSRNDAHVTEEQLETYLNTYYHSMDIARAVARHPACSARLLAALSVYLPEDAKQNPHYSEHQKSEDWLLFAELSEYTGIACDDYLYEPEIYDGAINKETPWLFMVNHWIEHGGVPDLRFIAGIEAIDEGVIEPLCHHKSSPVRKAIAQRKNISDRLAVILVKDKAKSVRAALAQNKNCPPGILWELAQDPENLVKSKALSNPFCPKDIHLVPQHSNDGITSSAKTAPVKSSTKDILFQLGHETTRSVALENLSQSGEAYVRAGVALHVNCPRDTLKRLADDPDMMVKQSVAFNPHTPEEVLQAFLDSNVVALHMALASNPSLTEAQQLDLAGKAGQSIQKTLADTTEYESVWQALSNGNKPKNLAACKDWKDVIALMLGCKPGYFETLHRGEKAFDLFVSKYIARHPGCPGTLIKHYAYYLYDSLSQNPNVALKLLENPGAVKAKPYAEWKVNQWLSEKRAPGHVTNYYLKSGDLKRLRQAVNGKTACFRFIQPLVFIDDTLLKKSLASRKGNTRFMFEILARDSKPMVREQVARNYTCHPSVLELLADDPVAVVKTAARQNPKLKGIKESLESLPGTKEEEFKNKGRKNDVVRMAQKSKDTALLLDLSGDKRFEVRQAVAENKKITQDIMMALARDEQTEVRRSLVRNDKIVEPALNILAGDEDDRIRFSAFLGLCNLHAQDVRGKYYKIYDEKILSIFYDDPFELIQEYVAKWTRNVDIQKASFNNPSGKVRCGLAANPHLDADLALAFVHENTISILKSLAKNTCNEHVYFLLLDHTDEDIVREATNNYNLLKLQRGYDQTIIQRLITHENPRVRKHSVYWARNASQLMAMAKDPDDGVREYVSYQSKLKDDLIHMLLLNPTKEICKNLYYRYKDIVSEYIPKFLTSRNVGTREFVAKYWDLSEEFERILSKDPEPSVRKHLIENDNLTSKEAVESLLNDPDEDVKKTAHFTNKYVRRLLSNQDR